VPVDFEFNVVFLAYFVPKHGFGEPEPDFRFPDGFPEGVEFEDEFFFGGVRDGIGAEVGVFSVVPDADHKDHGFVVVVERFKVDEDFGDERAPFVSFDFVVDGCDFSAVDLKEERDFFEVGFADAE